MRLVWPSDELEAVEFLDELSAVAMVRQEADNLRASVPRAPDGAIPPTRTVIEGRERERLHRCRERDPRLVAEAKASFKAKHGHLFCEVCEFNFFDEYGKRGTDFIEGHHTKSISELSPNGEPMKASDIAMVCSNCHSMIHVQRPWLSVHGLQACRKSARLGRECAKLDPMAEQNMAG